MSKYDFARRLQRLVTAECNISKNESKIARKSAKFYQEMANIKTTLNKQVHELSIYRKEIEKLKCCNKKIEETIQHEGTVLCSILQDLELMQTEYKNTLQQKIEQRHIAAQQMDCIRSLKQSTQCYLNFNALPQLIQGVTLCEKETSTDWKPFCIDPLKHTQKEVQNIIWHENQVDSIYRSTWEQLILGDIFKENNSNMEIENGNETVII